MEVWIGERWHAWVSRRAEGGHPEAAVSLSEVRPAVALLLRAAGAHQRLAAATPVRVGGPRTLWQRVAGSGARAALAQLDAEALALPEQLAVFPDRQRNRDLYLWLALQAAHLDRRLPWAPANLAATEAALAAFPGMRARWARLGVLPPPGLDLATLRPQDLAPIWGWVLPVADAPAGPSTARDAAEPAAPASGLREQLAGRRRTRRAQEGAGRNPLLLAPKSEWIKTFAEPFAIDRAEDDEPDADAGAAADQIETPTLQDGSASLAARVRFDLDLPADSADDLALDAPEGGEWFPEWDPRRQALVPDRVQARRFEPRPLEPPWQPEPALRALAQQLRRRLAVQQAAPRWKPGQRDGESIDLDAWVRHRAAPHGVAAVYRRQQRSQRDLATLLLADFSLSTDAHANSERRIIEVLQGSLYAFGEALAGSGDAFALLGFSSVRRQLRLYELKTFEERWSPRVQARLGAMTPGYYTRLGGAIRAATRRLQARPERQRLLLLLTDGKPHDLDGYDGRLGREDTREAVREARAAGLTPFAVSIDDSAPEVLPSLFGERGWAWVRRPAELPQRLAGLVGQLVR